MGDPLAKLKASTAPATKGFVVSCLQELLPPIVAELAALKRKAAELEAHGIKYLGTWQRAADYSRGNVTTHDGSAWCAIRATQQEPGKGADWQLMVKAGRDAR
jgi:hypothetical protein